MNSRTTVQEWGEAGLSTTDPSNGYDKIAEQFIAVRSSIGKSVIEAWASSFKPGDAIIDVGSGSGLPITSILVEHQFSVYAIDASPRLLSALQQRFPSVETACETAETSSFFGKSFDGVLAVGLIFLLAKSAQIQFLERVSKALKPGGRLLFSAPKQVWEWQDLLTDRTSRSLGYDEYLRILSANNMSFLRSHIDEGENHYFEAMKQTEEHSS